MKRSRSIVGIAVVVASIVLAIAGVVVYRSVQLLAVTSQQVQLSRDLQLGLERALSTLRDAETGQRGYLLTGSEEYLRPYSDALRDLDGRLLSIEAQLKASGDYTATTGRLRELVTAKLDELAHTISLYRSGKTQEAIQIVRSDQGMTTMNGIRTLIGERAVAEQRHVRAMLATQQDALRSTVRSSISLSALAIGLMALLAYVVKRDSARLRYSEERLATTLRSIGDGVIATDEHCRVTMANPVAEELTGWKIGQARGKPLDEIFRIVNEQTREPVESPVAKVLREGRIVGLANHTVLIHRAGTETAIEDSAAPITDHAGATTGVVLVFRDATEERAAQNALLAADRRKDEFLATLAHELRNPLAPIRQAAALAAHERASAEQVKLSHAIIERQSAHMARLLDDLLDVSRITRGRLEVRPTRVALKSIIESALETARPAIDAGMHQLTVDMPEEPIFLNVDALRIAQVLGNLFTNSAKYTDVRGQIRLTVEREGSNAVIRVADNGIGLAVDDLSKIFEMFAQVKPSSDRREAGLGIGLTLSKALIALHGGTLEAHSEGLGKGSEFVIRLPLATAI